jgi:hypothetical protein
MGDFFTVFWQALTSSFTPEPTNKACEATGLVNQHLIQMDNNGGGESSYHYELRIVPGAKVNGLAASGWYFRNYDNQIE